MRLNDWDSPVTTSIPANISGQASTGGGKESRQSPHVAGEVKQWQIDLGNAIRSVPELLQRLGLDELSESETPDFDPKFPVLVPEDYLLRMKVGDPLDPLLLQVLPLAAENVPVAGYTADAVGDQSSRVAAGLLHKYAGRVLMIASGHCAVHCRYCFRREYDYLQEPQSAADWTDAIDYIASDDSVHEVILSGGDPLTLSDRRLKQLLNLIDRIPHVRRIRIHTRLPIVLPTRVTDELLEQLTELRTTCWLVIHANHAAELEGHCSSAIGRIIERGVPVLNQTVLLHGVNDSIDQLQALSERLIDLRVMPYYLHQLDRVSGTSHFEVPVSRGRELVSELRRRVPGFAVPEYVSEIPGELHKTPLV